MQTEKPTERTKADLTPEERTAIIRQAVHQERPHGSIAARFNTSRGVVSSLAHEYRKSHNAEASRPVTIRKFSWQGQRDEYGAF